MILIADSGSTKTDWRLLDSGKISQFSTAGINPFFQDAEQVAGMLKDELLIKLDPSPVTRIFFYGAGCSTPANVSSVHASLSGIFRNAEVIIGTDMLGAAKALCGKNAGIACILGTGSNSCYYDGEKITENVPSFGYLFGDHGSGATIGKKLIQSWIDGKLPKDILQRFTERAGNTRENILEQVYRKPYPNRFLASYSKFVFQHLSHPFMTALVKESFHAFFESQVEKYSGHRETPVNAVGSIAFYYNTIFRVVAEERGLQVGNILETPIAALTLYHLDQE